MPLFRDIDFRTGGALDVLGAVPTITGTNFKNAELGMAFEGGLSKYIAYDKQLLPDNAFSVVVWARMSYSSILAATYTGIIGTSANMGSNGILLSMSGNSGKSFIQLGTGNYRIFNYIPDKKWHCWIFTIPGNTQTDIDNCNLYIDSVVKPVTSTQKSTTQVSRSGFIFANGASATTGGAMIARIKVYDTVIDAAQINREQEEFEQARALTRRTINNYPLANGNIVDFYENWKYLGVANKPQIRGEWIKGTGVYSVQQWVNNYSNNLVTNGDFSSAGIGSFSASRGTFINDSGIGKFTSTDASGENRIYIVAGYTVGHRYKIKFKAKSPTLTSTFITSYMTGYYDNIVYSINPNLNNTFQQYEIIVSNKFASLIIDFPITTNGDIVYIDDIVITEVQVKPNSFYLKCDTAGTLNIPFNKASGLWEFELLKGADANRIDVHIMSDRINGAIGASNAYYLSFHDLERLALNRSNTSTADAIITGTNASVSNNTWYKIRIYRLGNVSGKFPKRLTGDTVYNAWSWLLTVQGGTYTNETIVVAPATGNVLQSSKWMIIDADTNDLIGDIKHTNSWTL